MVFSTGDRGTTTGILCRVHSVLFSSSSTDDSSRIRFPSSWSIWSFLFKPPIAWSLVIKSDGDMLLWLSEGGVSSIVINGAILTVSMDSRTESMGSRQLTMYVGLRMERKG